MGIMLVTVTVILSGCAKDGKIGGGPAIGGIGGIVCTTVARLSGVEKLEKIAMIAAACGLVGYALGELVEKRQQGYANREEAIQTETEIVKRQTEKYRAENQKLAQDIRHYQQKIQNLRSDNALLQDQKREVEKRRQEAQSLLELVKTELDETNRQYRLQYYKGTAADADKLKKWKTQVAQLEQEKQMLQENVDTLFSMAQAL
jgi:small-conductance mechanosensitive channel